MSSLTRDFANALSRVDRPGDFFARGVMDFSAPGLTVEGVGPISLPLLPAQADVLIAVAERAPFGRGEETLVDTTVRRTWQIGPDKVAFTGKRWPSTLGAIVARAAEGLGVGEAVEAIFYKLLIYDEGSFFVGHRDTEKAAGMFATLAIALPSLCAGGELVVRHRDRQVTLDMRSDDPSEATFAAFYADCVHEVLPVTAGCRLTLIYNLVRKESGPAPHPPAYPGEQAALTGLLKAWAAGEQRDDEETPAKLVYPLAHAYTPAELAFATLKGPDAAAAQVAVAAARNAACDAHLALITVWETGWAEHEYSPRRWSDRGDDSFTVGDVDDREVTASDWRRPDGEPSPLTQMRVGDEEFSPPEVFEDLDPDDIEFREATGNEGATFERTYRRAALVLWPAARRLDIVRQAGAQASLPYLEHLTERWLTESDEAGSAARAQALALAGLMIGAWSFQRDDWGDETTSGDLARLLANLTRLRDTEGLEGLLARIADHGTFRRADVAAIVAASVATADPAGRLTGIIDGVARHAFGACAALLAQAVTVLDPGDLARAAARLVADMPGDPARTDLTSDPWSRIDAGVVADLLRALTAIDPGLSTSATDHMLAWPRTFDFDTILVPAAKMSAQTAAAAGAARLRDACVAHLRARVALPLAPPSDWRRTSKLGCVCEDCRRLAEFLEDPALETWSFKAAQPARSHVESTIRRAECDLACQTVRKGSPHILLCTKTQASYERRVEQRRDDLENLRRLGA
jgi:hypothetical protein